MASERGPQVPLEEVAVTRVLVCAALALGLAGPAPSVAGEVLGPHWGQLVGDWVAEGGGQPGRGEGGSSFRFELQERVLVRRAWATYPGANGETVRHEDLLVISAGPSPGEAKASYWDNEGHQISYTATWSEDGSTVTFLSEIRAAEPRYRLVYSGLSGTAPVVTFSVAPPGSPEAFRPYVTGTLRRSPGRSQWER